MAKSAILPGSSEPISPPRFRLYAALTVAAVRASAGVIFICAQANDMIVRMEVVGEEPGLKSVAITIARPASIIARAAGYFCEPMAYTEPGRRTGWTPACRSAAIEPGCV